MIKVALFIDLENVTKQIDYEKLIDGVTKTIDSKNKDKVNIVIRKAVGNEASLKKVLNDLNHLNFDIKLSIKNGSKKNKSDLIISTDAMECLVYDNPSIDYFIFVTSDSDFSIVASKLKKFGKKVCFVVKEEDVDKTIFTSVAENVINIKTYYVVDDENSFIIKLKKEYSLKNDNDVKVFMSMIKSLSKRQKNQYFSLKNAKKKFRDTDKSVKLNPSSFTSYNKLFGLLNEKGIIEYKKNNPEEIKVIGYEKINELLMEEKNAK